MQRKVRQSLTLAKIKNGRFGLEVKLSLLLGITELTLSLHKGPNIKGVKRL